MEGQRDLSRETRRRGLPGPTRGQLPDLGANSVPLEARKGTSSPRPHLGHSWRPLAVTAWTKGAHLSQATNVFPGSLNTGPLRRPLSGGQVHGVKILQGRLSFLSNPQDFPLAHSPPEPPRTKWGGAETPGERAEERGIAGKVQELPASQGAQTRGESWLCFLLAVWPGVSCLASLSLRSSISQREQ